MASKTTELTEQAAADVVDGDWFLFVDLTGPTSEKLSMASVRSAVARLGLNPPTTGIFAINGTTQFNYADGAVFPETDDDVDLGKTAQRWKDIYIDGTAYLDAINFNGTAISATAAEINYLDIATLGTGAASKAVVLDAGDDYTWPATGILTYGVLNDGTTALAATALEINRACDVSGRLVAIGATSLAVTVDLHSDKIIKLDHTGAASTCTLPAASGTGAVFRFLVTAVNTSNHVVAANGTDVLTGVVTMLDDDSNAATAYSASGTDDKITLNGTTTGGQVGDWLEFVDIAAATWAVKGALVVPAGSNVADPFSAT